MKSLLLVAGILVALIGLAFWKGSAARARAAYPLLPFGVVDNPRPGETLRGHAVLRGWALSEVKIESVAVTSIAHWPDWRRSGSAGLTYRRLIPPFAKRGRPAGKWISIRAASSRERTSSKYRPVPGKARLAIWVPWR